MDPATLPGTVVFLRTDLRSYMVKQVRPDGLWLVNRCDAIGPFGPDVVMDPKDFIPSV